MFQQLISLMLGIHNFLSLWRLPWIWTKCQTPWKALYTNSQGRLTRTPATKPSGDPAVVGRGCCPHATMPCLPGVLPSCPRGGGHSHRLWYPPGHSLGTLMSEINRDGRNTKKCSNENCPATLIPPLMHTYYLTLKAWVWSLNIDCHFLPAIRTIQFLHLPFP